jgi:hypothetical protein
MDDFLSALRIVAGSWPIAVIFLGFAVVLISRRIVRGIERENLAARLRDIEMERMKYPKQIENRVHPQDSAGYRDK